MAVLSIAVIVLVFILFSGRDNSQSYVDDYDSSTVSYSDAAESTHIYPAATNNCIEFISQSGYLTPAGNREYDGYQTIDGDPDTCWIVNTTEQGAAGAWIEYNFDGNYCVSGIKMINGNVYRDGYYFTNGHIKEFRLDFSNGASKYFTAEEVESRSLDSNVFYFDDMVIKSYVRLTIISSYIGTKDAYRTNSAMVEFEFF